MKPSALPLSLPVRGCLSTFPLKRRFHATFAHMYDFISLYPNLPFTDSNQADTRASEGPRGSARTGQGAEEPLPDLGELV